MLLRARQCLNQLETKFGESTSLSLLGGPSELDATLYAYLACIQNVLPHNDILRAHLKECKRLTQFVHLFQKTHFGDANDEATAVATDQADRAEEQRLMGTATTQDLEEERLNRWQSIVLAGCIACCAMALFAYKQGIFQLATDARYELQYRDEDADDDDDEPGVDDD